MDDTQRKAHIKTTFDTVAEGYGSASMEFFHKAAAHLPRVFALQGRITGIDLKQEHLAEINALNEGQGIPFNVTALFASGRVA